MGITVAEVTQDMCVLYVFFLVFIMLAAHTVNNHLGVLLRLSSIQSLCRVHLRFQLCIASIFTVLRCRELRQ